MRFVLTAATFIANSAPEIDITTPNVDEDHEIAEFDDTNNHEFVVD